MLPGVAPATSASVAKPTRPPPVLAFRSPPEALAELAEHSHALPEDQLQCARSAIAALRALAPPTAPNGSELPDEAALLRLVAALNANVHSLAYAKRPSDSFGFGLFPLCALFNHSCRPNVLFMNEGRRLLFRAIRAVAPGEELCVSYVALYQAPITRSQALLTTKGFTCKCERCTLQPATEEERTAFLADAEVGGVLCPSCRVGRVEPLALRERSAEEEEAEDRKGDEEFNAHKPVGEMPHWVCVACGARHSLETVRDTQNAALAVAEQAEEAYRVAAGSGKVSSARAAVEKAERTLMQTVCAGNEALLRVHLALVNIRASMGDELGRLKLARDVVARAEVVLPAGEVTLLNYLRALAVALRASAIKHPRVYAEELGSVVARLTHATRCAFGPDSDAVRRVSAEFLTSASA
jgi:hypothetical protein